ncbi:MAG: DUF6544 family protein [Vicinamibacterales bacterium]
MTLSFRTKFFTVIAIALAAVTLFGASAVWNGASNTLERELQRRLVPPHDLALGALAVPPPVQRFLSRSVPPGQKPIRTARLEQEGQFFLNGSWLPMSAHQFFTASPPAFMWDARIRMAPLLSVYVRDAYVGGSASMRARLLALYPIVAQSNRPELNEGALMRYLGEAAWLPTRLAPGNGLSWTAIDDEHAEATLTDGQTSVSLRFTIDASGAITEISSPGRYREVDGAYVRTPWRVRALGHEVLGGVRLMSPAEAEWDLPEGPLPYWRGRITRVEYTY